ncbi:MAG: dTDP-4-dehydrorhamnose 3,5-epimerase [Verrucomicrobiales bacterium]|nr:dTDP-4-dehydrorhamnose 3,5-epimerase [Verrucomicrobiales bacterium]
MQFHLTTLPGVWRIPLDPRADERGHFIRTYCEQEFAAHGLNTRWVQCNTTLTRQRGMLRGLHYQAHPHPEIKLIRCVSGAVFDVLVDVRPNSATFGKWEAFELRAEQPDQLYVPAGYAHGFQCLTEDAGLFYQMSEFYVPDLARGVRWDDRKLAIPWPISNPQLSSRDAGLPELSSLQS